MNTHELQGRWFLTSADADLRAGPINHRVDVRFRSSADGELRAFLIRRDNGAEMPLPHVRFDGRELELSIAFDRAASEAPLLRLRLSDEGDFVGNWFGPQLTDVPTPVATVLMRMVRFRDNLLPS